MGAKDWAFCERVDKVGMADLALLSQKDDIEPGIEDIEGIEGIEGIGREGIEGREGSEGSDIGNSWEFPVEVRVTAGMAAKIGSIKGSIL